MKNSYLYTVSHVGEERIFVEIVEFDVKNKKFNKYSFDIFYPSTNEFTEGFDNYIKKVIRKLKKQNP